MHQVLTHHGTGRSKNFHCNRGPRGIGRATARMLVDEGSSVAVTDVNEEEGRKTGERIRADGAKAAFFESDVTVEGD